VKGWKRRGKDEELIKLSWFVLVSRSVAFVICCIRASTPSKLVLERQSVWLQWGSIWPSNIRQCTLWKGQCQTAPVIFIQSQRIPEGWQPYIISIINYQIGHCQDTSDPGHLAPETFWHRQTGAEVFRHFGVMNCLDLEQTFFPIIGHTEERFNIAPYYYKEDHWFYSNIHK